MVRKNTASAVQTGICNTTAFSLHHLKELERIMIPQSIDRNTLLFKEGDPADKLFYIRRGKVKVTKLSEEGKELILYLFQEGDLFGQFDPFHDSVQQAAARAVEPCEIGLIPRHDLKMLLWQNSDMAVEFMEWMGLMQRLAQTKLRDLVQYGKQGALCSTLIRLSNSYGIERENGILISLKLTNAELAEFIGCARESVNRMLRELKKAGALRMDGGHMVITNLQYLKDICKCESCPRQICRI